MARYELSEGTSNKFWDIALDGASFTTTWGKIGTNGQSAAKTFDSDAKAKLEHDKLVAEKVKKGYTLVAGGATSASAPAKSAPPKPAAQKPVPPKAAPAAAAPAVAAPPLTPAPLPPQPEAAIAPTSNVTLSASVADADARIAVEWSTELGARAAKQGKALLIEPRSTGDVEASFATLRGTFMKQTKERLENGLVRAKEHQDIVKGVLRAYTSERPAQPFEPRVESAALTLLPATFSRGHYRSRESGLEAALIEHWIARAGVVPALEAWALNMGPIGFEVSNAPDAIWLTTQPNRTLDSLLAGRVDRVFRAHLAMVDEATLAAAKAKASELRIDGSSTVRSAMASIFLDPAWIEADLEAQLRSKERWIFSEEVLLEAPPALFARWLGTLALDEAVFLIAADHHYAVSTLRPFSAVYLERHREAGVAPLAQWLKRSAELLDLKQWNTKQLLGLMVELLDLLRCVSGSPDLALAAVTVLDKCAGEKLSKAEDPKPFAIDCLCRSPRIALSYVRDASKGKGGSWARDLLPRLERLAGVGVVPVAEAEPHEIPEVLRGNAPFKAPPFWTPEAFATIKTISNKGLPLSAVNLLGAVLAKSDLDEIRRVGCDERLERVKEACQSTSLAEFAWDLFQAWLSAGAPNKEKWAFVALGVFGNDDSARRLTPLIRAWPGESAHQRAVLGLDVLATIGSDVAMMMLNGIAQKLKFKGLQERAREKMDEIAKKRGLTAEELADRLVPDLDLEDDGSMVLDFGPRSFRVGFDETLAPFVSDASGARLKDLPKPGAKDETELATRAVEAWKSMKKDAKAIAALEILRLELAMANARRWKARDFDTFLVHHPLLIHVVRRLVWATFDQGGKLLATFRVAEDRTFATSADESFVLPDDAIVGVAHRLQLSDAEAATWQQLFKDYELAQPFEQLARDVFVLPPPELIGNALKRYDTRKVETKKLMALLGRGWRRGSAHDNGIVPYFYKPITRDINAGLQISGINVSSMEYTDAVQELGFVDFGEGEPSWSQVRATSVPLSTIDPIVMSEVVRDIESLGTVVEEAP